VGGGDSTGGEVGPLFTGLPPAASRVERPGETLASGSGERARIGVDVRAVLANL
jgi:hypothetical protein